MILDMLRVQSLIERSWDEDYVSWLKIVRDGDFISTSQTVSIVLNRSSS